MKEGDAGFTDAVFDVTLSAPLTQTASVAYTVVAGTASTGSDFVVPSGLGGRIAFAAGETRKSVPVRVVGDTAREANETFSVRLASPVNCTVGTGIATGTITDDDSYTLSVVAPTSTFAEGSPVTLTLKLSSPAKRRESVSFRTVSGTAREGLDFPAIAGRVVTFAIGQDTQTVSVPTFADGAVEGPEYFTITAQPLDARLGPAISTAVFITDGTAPQPVPSIVTVAALTAAAAEAGPTSGVFRFSRSGDVSAAETVNYAVAGTATAVSDYATLPGTVTFAAGQSFVDVSVAPVDDPFVEQSETVIVTLSTGTTYVVGKPASATVTITSDDITNPTPTTPPISQPGFQVDFVLPTTIVIPTDTTRMFTDAGKQWTAILGELPDVFDLSGKLQVDDFQLIVKFVAAPTDPVNKPWQQPGFGGAWFTDRRPGARGLPWRGEAEITTNALDPAFFNKLTPLYDKFSVYKTMELIGRAIGFNATLLTDPAFDLVRTYRLSIGKPPATVITPAVNAGTNAASKFAGETSVVPLDAASWSGVPHWSLVAGGSASFGFDIFLPGWQNQSSMNLETRPKISNVTRGLFADLGYTVRYR